MAVYKWLPQHTVEVTRAVASNGYDRGYTHGIKTAISIPDSVFKSADELARRLDLSRSELYARAVSRYVEQHSDVGITEALDRVYAQPEASGVDPQLARMQDESLPAEDW
ncbi:MAG: ribbon-helix-helix domain-containing protein [Candidatus Limnocylindrales bacterium]